MRRWGLIVSGFYAIVVTLLLLPATFILAGASWAEVYAELGGAGAFYLWPVALIIGQVLWFLPIDQAGRRSRPRMHVAITAVGAGSALGALSLALLLSLFAAIYGDARWPGGTDWVFSRGVWSVAVAWLGFWCLWAVIFYVYCRREPSRTANLVGWLIKGSILELLVAVPAHVVARRRNDCCADGITAFGITTGLAIMLMCLGPGVLALYRQRMLRYTRPSQGDRS